MPNLTLPTHISIDSDIAAAARISPTTWSLIIFLIVVVSGWGWATLANNRTNDRQDVALEKKADEKDVDRQYVDLIKRIDDLHVDVREIRDEQRSESRRRRSDRSPHKQPQQE